MPRDGASIYHRPPGIDAVTDTSIESTKYNLNVGDVEFDLNYPRPIVAGGTGATNAHDAMVALSGELANQLVDNYDTFPFVSGSFSSTTGATSAPGSSQYYGQCVTWYIEPQNYILLIARTLGGASSGVTYIREKTNGIWGAWATLASPNEANLKVSRAGDTMSGGLAVNMSAPSFYLNQTDDNTSSLWIERNGKARWQWQYSAGVESGSNSGADFILYRCDDAGNYINSPLSISRATGIVTLGQTTVNGTLATGNINVTGTLYASGSIVSPWHHFDTSGNHYINFDGNNFNIVGGNLYTSGSVFAGGSLMAGDTADAGTVFFGNTSNKYLQWDGSKYTLVGGTLNVSGLSVSGSFGVTGTFSVGGAFSCDSLTTAHNLNIGGTLGAGALFFGDANHYLNFNGGTGKYNLFQGALNVSDSSITSGGDIYCSGGGYQPGGGSWRDLSDARIKTVTGDYASGLDEVLALQPKRYTYKGNDTREPPSNQDHVPPGEDPDTSTPTVPYRNSAHYAAASDGAEFIGLIAQEAEVAMPELVEHAEGYIDGTKVTDIREINTGPLIFALVNAVKQLAARVEELEARQPAR